MINYIKYKNFNWDDNNYDKCQKHGVSIEEIESLFKRNKLYISADIKHSRQEERFLATGVLVNNRGVLVVFTLRTKNDDVYIRPISARYMHKKEQKKYEQLNKHW